MDAIILAGGFGTRLRPLTLKTPKPLVPVANRPFLLTLLWRLSRCGVRQTVLSTFHQASEIRKALRSLPHFGMRVSVVEERQPLGTGGAISFAWPKPRRECLVLNGDVLSDFKIEDLVAFHRDRKAQASIWVRPVEDVSAFGVLEFGEGNLVRRFVEKPRPGETSSRSINAGVYFLSPEVLDQIPQGRSVSVERETFPRLLEAGLGVFAFDGWPQAYWRDIGTPGHYLQANLDALAGRLGALGDAGQAVWPAAEGGSILAQGCRVDPDARVSESVLGKGCSLAKASSVRGSVLWEGCRIGEGAVVEGAILGRRVKVGAYSVISKGAVLGDRANIPAYSKI